MRIGRLNTRIVVSRRDSKRSDYGERSRAIAPVTSVMADISQPPRVSEGEAGENIQYVSDYSVTIRFNSNVKNGDYVTFAGMTFRVTNLFHDLRKRRFTKFDAVAVEGIE